MRTLWRPGTRSARRISRPSGITSRACDPAAPNSAAAIRTSAPSANPTRHTWYTRSTRHTERARVIGADDQSLGRPRELDERCFERRERPVALEVVRLDVRHYGDRGPQREERSIELIRLGDEEIAAADAGVPMPPCDTAAGESRGVSPGGRQSPP